MMARRMHFPHRSDLLLAVPAVALAAVAAWFRAWGLLALVVAGGAGLVWYRLQVARSAASEKFFGELGEETRLTGLQGSPSEMPADRSPAKAPAQARDDR